MCVWCVCMDPITDKHLLKIGTMLIPDWHLAGSWTLHLTIPCQRPAIVVAYDTTPAIIETYDTTPAIVETFDTTPAIVGWQLGIYTLVYSPVTVYLKVFHSTSRGWQLEAKSTKSWFLATVTLPPSSCRLVRTSAWTAPQHSTNLSFWFCANIF